MLEAKRDARHILARGLRYHVARGRYPGRSSCSLLEYGVVPLALRVMKVLGLVAFVGCQTPFEGDGFEPFDPPAVYLEWWSELSLCAGVDGDFDEVDWIVASSLTLDGAETYGVWAAPNTIYLKRFYVSSEPAVKHEMLHQLTSGEMPHAAPAFRNCTTASAVPPCCA